MNENNPPGNRTQVVPYRQLAPGTFDVLSRDRSSGATTVAGHVHVVGGGSNLVVEHWALRSSYDSPDGAQDMQVVKRATDCSSLASFLAEMHALESQGVTFSYVKAECYTFASLPS